MNVVVEPHNPRWAEVFAAEAELIRGALGHGVVAIHHIGSTAIPTIYAKPIIDVLVEADAIEHVDAGASALESLGYQAMGEFGIPSRRYFRKHNQQGVRTFHIHSFTVGTPDVDRHLNFRDFMIAHDEHAQRYSDLKRDLAQRHPSDISAYMEGKNAFIQDMEKRAAVWRGKSEPNA